MTKFLKVKSSGHHIEMIMNNVENPKSILLCLHGFNGDRWGDGYSKLKKVFQNVLVCAFDSAGHGNSEVPAHSMRLDGILCEIDDIVNYLNNTFPGVPINIFAVSYGAYRAMLYLLEHSKKINNVVFFNPAFKMLEILKEFKYDELHDGDTIPMKQSLNKYMSKAFLDDLNAQSVYKKVHNIQNKITVFLSSGDTLVPRAHTLEFCEMYRAKFIEVEGGHCPDEKNWEQIIEFLEKSL